MSDSNPTHQPQSETLEERLADVNAKLTAEIKSKTSNLETLKILKSERTRLEKEIAKSAKVELSDDERNEAHDAIKKELRDWLKARPYNYVLATDRYWLDKGTYWIPVAAPALLRERPSLANAIDKKLLVEVMQEDRRWFDRCTYTFAPVGSDTLNMMRKDFAPIVEGDPHWIFDRLIYSLAGGKQENIDHIEQLVLTKYLHPESTVIPALVFNDGGSTGKGVFVSRVLKALFGDDGVADNLTIDAVTGKHNSQLQGRCVWYINETQHGTYSHNKLKALVGSTSMWIEPKGVNSFEVPMISWQIISGNGIDGSVLLEGNGTDRRWSIITGGRELVDHLGDYMGTDTGEAGDWMASTGLAILSDRAEAGKWLGALYRRHGDANVSRGLHGADYRAVRGLQTSLHDEMFAKVFGDEDLSAIRTADLFQAYVDECASLHRKPMGRPKFHELARRYIADQYPDFHGRLTTNIRNDDDSRSKVDVYIRHKPVDKEKLVDNGQAVLRQNGLWRR